MAVRTVGVSFEKLIPDAAHASAIRGAVERVHRCTLLATELLNLYVRDRLQHHGGAGLQLVCDANWLLNAYNEVTHGRTKTKVISELRATRDAHMPAFAAVDRDQDGGSRSLSHSTFAWPTSRRRDSPSLTSLLRCDIVWTLTLPLPLVPSRGC